MSFFTRNELSHESGGLFFNVMKALGGKYCIVLCFDKLRAIEVSLDEAHITYARLFTQPFRYA